jgi:hypothetical protein
MNRTLAAILALAPAACTVEAESAPPRDDAEHIAEFADEVGTCDSLGVCGNDTTPSTCIRCAVTGPCKTGYNACAANAACSAYAACEGACSDAACRAACQSANPVGWTRYAAVLHCIGCRCPVSCGALGETCP